MNTDGPGAKTSFYRIAWKFFKKLLPFILLFLIVRTVAGDWAQIQPIVSRMSPAWLCASLILFFLGVTLIGWNWVTALRLLGSHCGLLSGYRSFFYSQLVKYIPGRVWGAAGRIILAREAGVPEGTSVLGITLESLLLMCSAAIVGIMTAGDYRSLPAEILVIMIAAPLLTGFLHPRVIHRCIRFLSRRFPDYVVNLDGLPGMGMTLWLLIRYCLVWVFQGMGLWCMLRALVDLSADRIPLCIGGNALAWLAGFVVVLTPAGLGVREVIVTRLTKGVIGVGPAAMVALISRLAVIISELSGSLVILVLTRTRFVEARPNGRPAKRSGVLNHPAQNGDA